MGLPRKKTLPNTSMLKGGKTKLHMLAKEWIHQCRFREQIKPQYLQSSKSSWPSSKYKDRPARIRQLEGKSSVANVSSTYHPSKTPLPRQNERSSGLAGLQADNYGDGTKSPSVYSRDGKVRKKSKQVSKQKRHNVLVDTLFKYSTWISRWPSESCARPPNPTEVLEPTNIMSTHTHTPFISYMQVSPEEGRVTNKKL